MSFDEFDGSDGFETGNEFEKISRKNKIEIEKNKQGKSGKKHYLDSDSVYHDKRSDSRKNRRQGRNVEIPDEDDAIFDQIVSDYVDEKMGN